MAASTDGRTHVDLLDVRSSQRARRWSDLLDEFYYQSNYTLPADFQMGRLDGFQFDDLRVGRMASDPMVGVRAKSHVARNPTDAYFVALGDTCPITMTQNGRVARIERKSFMVISTMEPSSYHQADAGAHVNILIPGDLMRGFAPRIDDRVAIPFGRDPLHAIFFSTATKWVLSVAEMTPQSRALVAKSIINLLGLVIDGADQFTQSVVGAAHRHRIERIIQARYADPALNPAFVAKRMKLSPRYIRSILAAQGTTLSRLIKERRVAEALRLRHSGAAQKQSLQALALAVGYADLNQFHKDMESISGQQPSPCK